MWLLAKNKLAIAVSIVLLLLGAALWFGSYARAKPVIKVGILHSLSGTMALNESKMVEMLQFAIDEANAAGGIKGSMLQAVVADCRSDTAYCAQQAEHLIREENVSVLFGCWTSSCRKAVRRVVETEHHLMFYSLQYEGMEQSPNIIYTGAAPNQQIIPGVNWALQNLGKRIYLVGSDYVFPRMANIIIKDLLLAQHGELSGEAYLPLGARDMDGLVADIARKKPQVVLNLFNGDSNAHFFAALDKAGMRDLPLLSFSVGEVGMKSWNGAGLEQHYSVWNYFQSLPGEKNRSFVAACKASLGAERMISAPEASSYVGFQLWLQAVREAGSAEPSKVQRTILRQTLNAPEGMVAVDKDSRHLWLTPRIGKVRLDGQYDIVWDAGTPLEPMPFPSYRFKDDWLQLLKSVEEGQS